MKGKKQTIIKAGILACGLAAAGIGTFSMAQGPRMAGCDWTSYLAETAVMIGAGLLLVCAYHRFQNENRDAWFVLAAAAAAGLAVWSLAMRFQSWQMILQQFLLALWPLILMPWAYWLKARTSFRLPELPYYLSAAAGAWLLLDVLMPAPWLKWEIFSLLYMLAVAYAAWNSRPEGVVAQIWEFGFRCLRRKSVWKQLLRAWLPLVLAAAAIVCLHERTRDILMTLSHPFGVSEGGLWEVNWLTHRLRLMAACWHGDYSLLPPGSVDWIAVSNPLLWIKESLGVWSVLAVVAAQILMVWLLHKLRRNTAYQSMCLSRVMVFAVTAQTVLGLTAEGMVNTSTLLGASFFRSPASCLLLPLAAAADIYLPAILKRTVRDLVSGSYAQQEAWQGDMVLERDGIAGITWAGGCMRSMIRVRWRSRRVNGAGAPLAIRIPQESRVEEARLPIRAAGKTYRYLSQLICGGTAGPEVFRDIYGRQVLCIQERFPTFDAFDSMYENRYCTWYFLWEGGKLTRILQTDDSDVLTITEDVREMEYSCWLKMGELGLGLIHQNEGDQLDE